MRFDGQWAVVMPQQYGLILERPGPTIPAVLVALFCAQFNQFRMVGNALDVEGVFFGCKKYFNASVHADSRDVATLSTASTYHCAKVPYSIDINTSNILCLDV
ncbi:MAG: hypothetical protein WCC54_06470 [Pseudolabrys sp.]